MNSWIRLIFAASLLGLVASVVGCSQSKAPSKRGPKSNTTAGKPKVVTPAAEKKKDEEKKPAESPPVEEKTSEAKKSEEPKAEEKKTDDKKPEEKKAEDKKPEEPKPEEKKAEEKKPAETPPAEEKKPEDKKPEESKPDASKATAVPAAGKKVVLGSPELTAGIPGEGPLTVAQVSAWLALPENHETLVVELPLGLAAAAANISIPEDNPLTRAKIELGRQLYFDPRLSSDEKIACASCHHPDEGYGKHTQFGVGIRDQVGGRNSPVSYNRILSGAQFWDGRAASLEEQAKGPIANPIEMGNTHEKCMECVKGIEGYKVQFEKIFGPNSVTIDNAAKAIASFERTLVTGPAPYDYYETVRSIEKQVPADDLKDLAKDNPALFAKYEQAKKGAEAMNESARRGRELFFTEKANCTACHAGANFTDEKYHNLGVGMDKEKPDVGRAAISKDEKDTGAFKTPTIRNVALSAPYMHDGSMKTLEEVVEWYAKGGHPNPHLSDKVKKLNLSEQDKKDLVEFMKACTGEFPKVQTARLPQ